MNIFQRGLERLNEVWAASAPREPEQIAKEAADREDAESIVDTATVPFDKVDQEFVRQLRQSVKEYQRGSSTAPPAVHKPGPARIRVSLSRSLSVAEIEYINYHLVRSLDRTTWSSLLAPGGRGYTVDVLPFHVRLSRNGKLYAESNGLDSRTLFTKVKDWIEGTFVNVFPTAVRTFRELS